MIPVAPGIAIDEAELEERFIRASGPGGQNVNKVATAVQLRFDTARAAQLSDTVLARLRRIAGRRMTEEGVLVIEARRFRTQEQNRRDARERLVELIRRACVAPRPRRATRPTASSRKERLETKKRRGRTKNLRRVPPED